MASKYLVHAYHQSDADCVTLHLDDKMFKLFPDEPLEIDRDSNGRALDTPEFYAHEIVRQYGPIFGIVEVPSAKTRTGITLDVEGALEKAQALLIMNRHRHINQWAADQIKTRVNKNLPVMPPTGFVAESIKLLNVDLRATYNITPIGWDFRPGSSAASVSNVAAVPVSDQSEEVAVLRSELEEMRALMQQVIGNQQQPAPQTPPSDKHKSK